MEWLAIQTASSWGSAISVQGLCTGQGGRKLRKTSLERHAELISIGTGKPASPSSVPAVLGSSLSQPGSDPCRFSQTAARTRHPTWCDWSEKLLRGEESQTLAGTEEGLAGFPIPTETSSVEPQQGPGVWKAWALAWGAGTGATLLSKLSLSAHSFPGSALVTQMWRDTARPLGSSHSRSNFGSKHKVLFYHFNSKAYF